MRMTCAVWSRDVHRDEHRGVHRGVHRDVHRDVTRDVTRDVPHLLICLFHFCNLTSKLAFSISKQTYKN